jgi:Right handed beta helix region
MPGACTRSNGLSFSAQSGVSSDTQCSGRLTDLPQRIAQIGGSPKAPSAPPASEPNRTEPLRPLPGPQPAQTSVTFYVSATDGDDDANGRASKRNCPPQQCGGGDGPFATFKRAQRAVRDLDKRNLRSVIVQFEDGTYFLAAEDRGEPPESRSIALNAADSGSADTEIVYENFPGAKPVISGGMRVRDWKLAGENRWIATLPEDTENFENLYVGDERRLRPRLALPAGGGDRYLGSYLRIEDAVYVDAEVKDRCPKPAQAEGPHKGKFLCLDRFIYNTSDPISSSWRNLTPDHTVDACKNFSNVSTAPIGDIELVDFEQYAAARLHIACVDGAKRIVYMTGPTAHQILHENANGFKKGRRYLIENIEDDLSQPGQWFLDRSKKPWTLTYVGRAHEDPNELMVITPQLGSVLTAANLQHVTFRGLTFAHDNAVLPMAGYSGLAPIQAGVSFQNTHDVTFEGNVIKQISGVGLEFISCPATGRAKWCVADAGEAVNTHNTVRGNVFYDLGANGLRIGMSARGADTKENVAHDIVVEDNVIVGYGRTYVGATGIVQGNGHHNLYTHNDVHDGYKGAIHICYCSPFASRSHVMPSDNTVSYNLVYDLFQGIMNDSGSIYLGVGTPGVDEGKPDTPQVHASGTGNRILNNVVHDVSDASALDKDGYGGDGLYLDDFTTDVEIRNNLVYRVSDNAVSFSGPRATRDPESGKPYPASVVKNNIFAFARRAMLNAYNPYSFKIEPPTPNPLFFVATNNIFYFDRSGDSMPPDARFHVQGGCAYPGGGASGSSLLPYTGYQVWNSNIYWHVGSNFANEKHAFYAQFRPSGEKRACLKPKDLKTFDLRAWRAAGEDIESKVLQPEFKNPGYPDSDFSLLRSPGLGYEPFDPKEAGPRSHDIAAPKVLASFPTAPFDPRAGF